MYADESIRLTKKITDFKDISKVFSNFTKSFTLPATPINNSIFSHYYNIDVSGVFDPQQKVPAYLEADGVVVDYGNVELLSVSTKKHRPSSYKVVFYGQVSELKNVFGSDTLDVLDLSALDHAVTQPNITLSWVQGLLSGNVVYPMTDLQRGWIYSTTITGDQRNIYTDGILVTELKPAVRLKYIWDKIFDHYGFTYESSIIDTSGIFYNTYMLMHREAGDLRSDENLIDNYTQCYGTTTRSAGAFLLDWDASQAIDNNGNFDFVNDKYVVPNTGNYQFNLFGRAIAPSLPVTMTLYYSVDGGALINLGSNTYSSPPGPYGIVKTINAYLYAGQELRFYAEVDQPCDFSHTFTTDYYPLFIYNEVIDMTANLPKKVKVVDFMNSIIRMFNLLIYPESETHFIIENKNDFYQNGAIKNWENIIDIDQIELSKPDIFGDISFEYGDTEDAVSKFFEKTFGRKYGSTLFSPEIEYAKDSLEVSVDFGPTIPVEMVDQDASGTVVANTNIHTLRMLDDENKPMVDIPRIFYYDQNQILSTSPFEMQNGVDASGLATFTTMYTAPYVSMFTDVSGIASTESLNFSIEEPTRGIPAVKTLYQEFYNTYVQRVFDPQQRSLKVKVYLSLAEYHTLEMSDNIFFNGHYYTIDSLKYDLSSKMADLELSVFFRDKTYRTVSGSSAGGGVSMTSAQGVGNTDDLYNLNGGVWRKAATPTMRLEISKGKPTRLPSTNYVINFNPPAE